MRGSHWGFFIKFLAAETGPPICPLLYNGEISILPGWDAQFFNSFVLFWKSDNHHWDTVTYPLLSFSRVFITFSRVFITFSRVFITFSRTFNNKTDMMPSVQLSFYNIRFFNNTVWIQIVVTKEEGFTQKTKMASIPCRASHLAPGQFEE